MYELNYKSVNIITLYQEYFKYFKDNLNETVLKNPDLDILIFLLLNFKEDSILCKYKLSNENDEEILIIYNKDDNKNDTLQLSSSSDFVQFMYNQFQFQRCDIRILYRINNTVFTSNDYFDSQRLFEYILPKIINNEGEIITKIHNQFDEFFESKRQRYIKLLNLIEYILIHYYDNQEISKFISSTTIVTNDVRTIIDNFDKFKNDLNHEGVLDTFMVYLLDFRYLISVNSFDDTQVERLNNMIIIFIKSNKIKKKTFFTLKNENYGKIVNKLDVKLYDMINYFHCLNENYGYLSFFEDLERYLGDINKFELISEGDIKIKSKLDLELKINDFYQSYVKPNILPKKKDLFEFFVVLSKGWKFIIQDIHLFKKWDWNNVKYCNNSSLQDNHLANQSDMKKPEYTLVFLGESGVGKSTLICGIENYLKYQTFDEAKKNKMNICIPLKFSVTRRDTPTEIVECIPEGGINTNENFNQIGQSVTQYPKIYRFEYQGCLFKVIDTPGLSDTRGYQQDLKNKELIRKIIHEQGEIHAICLVLRSNEARLTIEFEHSTRQLLSLFPKTALKNVFFFFTFAAGTFFAIGDSITMLRRLQEKLEETHGESFRIEENTCCVDSESLKYLLSKERGVLYSDRPEHSFDHCWNHSAKQITDFLTFLRTVKPVNVSDIKIMFEFCSLCKFTVKKYKEMKKKDQQKVKKDILNLINYIRKSTLITDYTELTIDDYVYEDVSQKKCFESFHKLFNVEFNEFSNTMMTMYSESRKMMTDDMYSEPEKMETDEITFEEQVINIKSQENELKNDLISSMLFENFQHGKPLLKQNLLTNMPYGFKLFF